MAWFRYVLYFFGVALLTAILVQLEVTNPGTLRLQEFVAESDTYGTSEFSTVEIIQLLILLTCGLLMGWVARNSHTQRPLAILFGGLALVFMIRELHYFLDQFVIDNLWQVLAGICGALLIAYSLRHLKRMNIALARIWPSAGLTLIFAGAVILFAYSTLVGHEPLWQAMLGDAYARIIKLAVEEFIELIGYLLWLIGTIEYVYSRRRSWSGNRSRRPSNAVSIAAGTRAMFIVPTGPGDRSCRGEHGNTINHQPHPERQPRAADRRGHRRGRRPVADFATGR